MSKDNKEVIIHKNQTDIFSILGANVSEPEVGLKDNNLIEKKIFHDHNGMFSNYSLIEIGHSQYLVLKNEGDSLYSTEFYKRLKDGSYIGYYWGHLNHLVASDHYLSVSHFLFPKNMISYPIFNDKVLSDIESSISIGDFKSVFKHMSKLKKDL